MQRRTFIVVGGGGFGKEVLWTALSLNTIDQQYDILGYCDDDPAKKGQMIYDYSVLGTPEEVDANIGEKPCFTCSIGDNEVRAQVVARVLALGWTPVSIIHPSVIIADDVVIGDGSYVGPQAILCPNATIGNHAIVNIGSTIGHDSVLGDFAQVSPGGRVSGASVLKEGALMGSNAVVAQRKSVGRYAILGACSLAMNDIPDTATAVGIPARVTFVRT